MKTVKDFKRIDFALLPTAMYKLTNISRELGKNIYIKRDDMTGVSFGGNKVRTLEFLLADAFDKGCDYVITTGGAQSNHAMLTAACANRIGMKSKLVLQGRGVMAKKGNLILNDILDAEVSFVDSDDFSDVYEEMNRVKDELTQNGHKAYFVPLGGSVPLGSLGYVNCAAEIFSQADSQNIRIDHIVNATGSGGTQSGLTLGAALYGSETKVTGIAVGDGLYEENILGLTKETADLLELAYRGDIKNTNNRNDLIDLKCNIVPCFGEGYAIPSPEGMAAIKMMATTEGLILDPVYTGKAFAGLIKLITEGYFDDDENILFVHTGGTGGVFAVGLE